MAQAQPQPDRKIQPLRVIAHREIHRREAEAGGVTDLVEFHAIYTPEVVLHVGLAGPSDGEPVVLLHGFPDFWLSWAHQIRPLVEAGYRVIMPDQRGYNLSEKPRQVSAYRLERLGPDITGILDALGYEKAHLVGHDWGGALAWWLAENCAERFLSLSILNCPPADVMGEVLRREVKQLRKSWYIALFQLPKIPEVLAGAKNCEFLAQALVTSSAPGTFGEEELTVYREAWSRPGALSGMINWYRAARSNLIKKSTKERIEIPTQILWGKKDIALDELLVEPSLAKCRDGRVHWFEEAGHWVHREAPEEVSARLLEFFELN